MQQKQAKLICAFAFADANCWVSHATAHISFMILNNNRLKSDSHYHFRLQLACLHFNENSNRMQDVTKDGEAQWQVSVPKYKQGAPVAKQVKVAATYSKYRNTCWTP